MNAHARAETRVALVIGNSAYRDVPQLSNPVHDAGAIAALFKSVGFETIELHHDLAGNDLRRVIRHFSDAAQDADMAVVFYAGHGIEVNGANYLVPVDARLDRDIDVEDEAVSLDRVLQVIEPAKRLRLVILDACRDNPFLKTMKRTVASRSIGRGLAEVAPATTDTLIAFAARPGSTAVDGQGQNSPFTAALLKNLATPGLDVRLALGRVRDEVLKATRRKQEPFFYGSLGGETVALVPAPQPQRADATPLPEASDPVPGVRRDYEFAERIGTRQAWDSFLATHGAGFFADLARAQREKLDEGETRGPVAAISPPLAPAPLVCGRGFRAEGGRCVEIVCKHGYALGEDGECERKKDKEAREPRQRNTEPTVPGLASTDVEAAARAQFDGSWRITSSVVKFGDCHALSGLSFRVVDGRLQASRLSGRVDAYGRVAGVSREGGHRAYVIGQLSTSDGSGDWRMIGGCSGHWTAARP